MFFQCYLQVDVEYRNEFLEFPSLERRFQSFYERKTVKNVKKNI